MVHTRGAPYHRMTQGKIERYYRSMKNIVKPQNYYFSWELEQKFTQFVDYLNNYRYHESLNNVTPPDVYFGRNRHILTKRRRSEGRGIQSSDDMEGYCDSHRSPAFYLFLPPPNLND